MLRLKGAVQHYAWGDRFALPELLEVTADGRPWAEIWYGTHPRGPSQIDESLHLPAPTFLADEVGELPFLVKLLAAAQPLSLQTHPSAEQAEEGFAREESEGVPLDSPERIFVDRKAKPELVICLDGFEALCGLATREVALRQCEEAGCSELADFVVQMGVADTFRALVAGPLMVRVGNLTPMISRLLAHHDDVRVTMSILMNHVKLSPGEALYLDAGTVHAYLGGLALEVQGNSDNVVRALLTEKHTDVRRFFSIARLDASGVDVRVPTERISPTTVAYRCPAPFTVMRHELNGTFALSATTQHTVLVCTSGRLGSLTRGGAAYVAAGESVALEGTATVYTVSA